ncbi:MAG TPA: F0F1 ATP synthase subunit B [Phycisphaerae bacterium]|nr:F0F1 ATP synthase subunit B [Phycisphaerae bacterium]
MLLRHMPSTFLRCAVATALLPVAPALGAEGGPNVGDIGQAVAAILIFLLLLAVLGRWAWKPIVHQLHSREESIARAINDAQRRDQESQELLKLYRNRLDRAEAEVAEILASGRKEAAVARDQILQAASDEARKSASAARQEIDQARRDALRDLYETTAELAAEMAETVLRRNLSDDDRRRIVGESLQELRKRGPEA